MLERLLPFFKKPGLLHPVLKLGRLLANLTDLKQYPELKLKRRTEALYRARERRVLDAIFMKRTPDRVPVIANGVNFFPAHHAGITTREYMFEPAKMRHAVLKFCKDFDFDMYFNSYILGFGGVVEKMGVNLLKIPGRDLGPHSGYQYNEIDRLRPEEYAEFLERGMDFLVDTIAGRCAVTFRKAGVARVTDETRALLEFAKFARMVVEVQNAMRSRGAYCIFGSAAFPPFDIMSFVFRTVHSLARDLMKRKYREKVVELCERMNPWLVELWSSFARITGMPGVWFTLERAFSLSPRQFKRFYWPTCKQMILAFVDRGLIPFITIEGDVTHLAKFFLELPPRVARRCVFNCDTSDIHEVNRVLDGHMAIAGNIPLSTMCVGTPRDVEKACEQLFAELKPGGGYLLSPALGIPDEAKPENVHAMIKYAHAHGEY